MAVTIEVNGLTRVERFLKGKEKEVQSKVKKAIGKAAILVQGEVKQSIAGNRPETKSVDTGRFLNSVDVNIEPDSAEVFSDLSYAEKLEDGSSRFKARNHFKNTAARTSNKVAELMDQELRNI